MTQLSDEINTLIKTELAAGTKWALIAKRLNRAGHRTARGNKWSSGAVSGYAWRLGMRARTDENGAPREAHVPAKRGRKRKAKPTAGPTHSSLVTDMEDVFTSNLSAALKLNLIKLLVQNDNQSTR